MIVKITEIHFPKWRKSDQTQAIKHNYHSLIWVSKHESISFLRLLSGNAT